MAKKLAVELYFANVNDFNQVPLTKHESEKVNTLKSKKRQQEYAISRWLRRKFLSLKTNLPSEQINFKKNVCGKPHIEDQTCYFNISHSHDWVVLAMCESNEIGVDIQKQEHKKSILEIAKQYFSIHEYVMLKDATDKQRTINFYKLWTAKEAVLKALGTGISTGLDKYNFTIENDSIKSYGSDNHNILLSQFIFKNDYIFSTAVLAHPNIQMEIKSYQVTKTDKWIRI